MRVTQNMLANNSLSNLSQSYNRLGALQDQLSTGKKITKPSDDPVVAMKGMYYRSNLTSIEQYKRNLSELYLWTENSESGIEQANSGLQRVRELTIQGKNGSLSPEDQKAIATEIEQIKLDLVNTAETQIAGRYIYHGTDVETSPIKQKNPPIVADNLNTSVIDDYKVEVSQGVYLKANVTPTNVFSQKLFDTVQGIEDALKGGATDSLDYLLSDLDDVMSTLSAERSELGARYNRLEMIDDRLSQQEITATRVLSDNEDVDMERTITDLKTQESVHRAALSASARIIQPTLLDFLR
ncbi:flagellar hook-associated protein FlgL [Bacillus sp. 2205SS5-2]|uniref:flagellar hook-associated protein FlgL n=1 Tax=Bacillus sp. 2205SS5-2 TaxID=3109031 RepID=UPI0030041A6F